MMPALSTLETAAPAQAATVATSGAASGEGGLFGQILTAAMVPTSGTAAEAVPVAAEAAPAGTPVVAMATQPDAASSDGLALPVLDEDALASLLSLAEGALAVQSEGAPQPVLTETATDDADTSAAQTADTLLALPAGAIPQPLLPARVAGQAPTVATAVASAVQAALPEAVQLRRAQIESGAGAASNLPQDGEPVAAGLRILPAAQSRPAQAAEAARQTVAALAGGQLPLPAAFTALSPALAGQLPADWQLPATESDAISLAQAVEGGVTPSLPPQAAAVAALASGRTGGLTLAIPQHVQDAGWADAFSQRLVMLAQQGTQSASLQLNPVDLGPIQVKVSVTDQVANIEFAARHASTGELIESALPRLAHALDLQGIRLDDVRVSHLPARSDSFSLAAQTQQGGGDARGQSGQSGQPGGSAPGQQTPATPGGRGREDGQGREPAQRTSTPRLADSGIDYYA